MRYSTTMLLLFLLLSGCAGRGGTTVYDGVTETYPFATHELAAQAAARLAAIYAPGRTTLHITGDASDQGQFGPALETALRKHGFGVTADPSSGFGLGYALDMVERDGTPTCYMQIRMADGSAFGQLYSLRNGIVVAAGNVTQTGLPNVIPAIPPAPPVAATTTWEPAPAASEVVPTPAPSIDALAQNVVATSVASNSTPAPEPVSPAPELPAAQEPSLPVEPAPAAVAPSVAEEVVTPKETEEWAIRPGSLKAQLEDWSNRAGHQLIWKASHDFQMQSHAVFRDSFIGSVKRLVARMHLNGNALRVTIYQENNVVEVTED